MADGAAEEVARGGAPGAVEDPRERDEREREVGRGDCYEAEERDGRGGVSSRPEVDGHEGERGGEEGEVHEWGERLEGRVEGGGLRCVEKEDG